MNNKFELNQPVYFLEIFNSATKINVFNVNVNNNSIPKFKNYCSGGNIKGIHLTEEEGELEITYDIQTYDLYGNVHQFIGNIPEKFIFESKELANNKFKEIICDNLERIKTYVMNDDVDVDVEDTINE